MDPARNRKTKNVYETLNVYFVKINLRFYVTINRSARSPKRCLFGKLKPNEVDQFLEENLRKLQQEKIKEFKSKYGFDIEKNCPPRDSNGQWVQNDQNISNWKFKRKRQLKNPVTNQSEKGLTGRSRIVYSEEIKQSSHTAVPGPTLLWYPLRIVCDRQLPETYK